MQYSPAYIIGFAASICLVASLFVAGSAVGLRDLQERNRRLDLQEKVLTVSGLVGPDEDLSDEEISSLYASSIEPKVIDLKTGELAPEIDPTEFDQREASTNEETSFPAPTNQAKIRRLPEHAMVFDVKKDGELQAIIIPIEGYGLWGTLYGYLALAPDARTIVGITFYEHGETPGLGGEVDNPRWKALWPGRLAYDERGNVVIQVVKGTTGPPEKNPYKVDGLSGATITSRGVTNLLRFWLGEEGFGPYLEQYRNRATA